MVDIKKHFLIVINDGPYGSERPYNALRHAMEISKDPALQIRVFLVGDAVQCAVTGQDTHKGFYNVERMMSSAVRHGEVAT